MSNRNKNSSNRGVSHKAMLKTRRENEKLTRQEFVVSGVDVIDRDANPTLPQNRDEIAHDASKLFASHATNEAFVRFNHNIKHRYDKLPFPMFGVTFGGENNTEKVATDSDKKERMLNNIAGAVASYGGGLAVFDMATIIESNRRTEMDAAKISKILRDPETSMAVVLYPEEMPRRHSERASAIENVLAVESDTPLLGLVIPAMQPHLESGAQIESGTVSGQLDPQAESVRYD